MYVYHSNHPSIDVSSLWVLIPVHFGSASARIRAEAVTKRHQELGLKRLLRSAHKRGEVRCETVLVQSSLHAQDMKHCPRVGRERLREDKAERLVRPVEDGVSIKQVDGPLVRADHEVRARESKAGH